MAVTITYQIPGVPLLNQLHEPTDDKQPDENARMNCVFASNAALATALLHRPFNGDELKDANPHYGQGYTGGASEANMVAQMAGLGITITRVKQPTQQLLLDALHWQIEHYHRACIITMPSQWNSAVSAPGYNPRTYSGPSHVGLACGTGPNGAIRVMNPWGGFWHDGDGAYWMARLLEGEFWVGELAKGVTPVATQGVPSGWKDDGKTLVAPNGVPVVSGFREYILSHAWDARNTPIAAEYTTAQVEYFQQYGPGSRQDFLYASLIWTAAHGVQVPPIGRDLGALVGQVRTAQAQIATLQAQIKQLQQQPPAPKPDPVAENLLAAVRAAAK